MVNPKIEKIEEFRIKAEEMLTGKGISKKQAENLYFNFIEENREKAARFAEELSAVKKDLKKDLKFFYLSDPAVDSEEEIRIAYPGFRAISYYRLAHILYRLENRLEARILTEKAHSLTGIDIHPGASIQAPFFIDHGTGIVIGETTVIGKNAKIYQGVTLGALALSRGIMMKGTKRHPTIGDSVTIYAGASVLGNVTIGSDVTIGSNVFVLEDIESHMRVTNPKPELILKEKKKD